MSTSTNTNTDSTEQPEVKRPHTTLWHTFIVVTTTLAVGLWISTMAIASLAESGDVPRVLFQLLFTGAATSTVTATILVTSYLSRQACATNNALLVERVGQLTRSVERLAETCAQSNAEQIGQLAREVEQLSARVEKVVKPWEAYAVGYSDGSPAGSLGGHDRNQ